MTSNNHIALRTALIYLIGAECWIIFSDLLIQRAPGSGNPYLFNVEVFKGTLFVLITSTALYFLLRYQLRQRQRIEAQVLYQANILQNVSDAIIATDLEYRVQSWNSGAERMYGWRADETIGRTVGELVKPIYSKTSREQVVNDFQEHGGWRGETIHHRKDGKPLHIIANVSYMKDGKGNQIGMVTVNRDVTKQFQMQQKLQQTADMLNAVITASPLGIVHLDADWRVRLWNPASEQLYGVPASEMIGKPLPPIPDDKHPVGAQLRESLMRGETITNYETQRLRSDGSVFDVSFSAAPLFNEVNECQGAIIIVSDISNRKRLEAEVFEKDRLSAALENERKVQAIRTRFMRMISHEFRTPLTIISTSYDMLKTYNERMTPDQRSQRLDNISEQVAHLRDLLNEVSLLLNTDPSLPNFAPAEFDLVPYCEDQITEIRHAFGETHTLHFVLKCDAAPLNADSKLLRHVVNNLIFNAIKYSPEGSTVTVTLDLVGSDVVLKVTDSGIGIPEEDCAHIFEPFYRASNVDETPGSGLGLAIVKQIVDLHQGEIEVDSRIGEGTTFTVTLPLSQVS